MVHYVAIDGERVYSSDDDGDLIIWDLAAAATGVVEDVLVRRFKEKEERGAIDCIQVRGSKLFTSYDNYGKIVIQDFW